MTPDAAVWLFVPGAAPSRFDKAVAAGADVVILDLEDAVRAEAKAEARATVAAWLHGGGRAWVRVNGTDTAWHGDDLDALVGLPGLAGVVLPMSDSADRVDQLRRRLHGRHHLAALIETARGVDRAADIAAAGADRLIFGSLDFGLDVGCDQSRDALLLARSTLVMASRLHGLPGPVDGVTPAVKDAELTADDARYARSIGFAGKLCVHPAQVEPVRAAFRPSEDELAWARSVLDTYAKASGGAAVGPDGQMVDQPVLDRARSILHH